MKEKEENLVENSEAPVATKKWNEKKIRRQKIKLMRMLKNDVNLRLLQTMVVPEEETDDEKKEREENSEKLMKQLTDLTNEISALRMNKNNSKAFEWHPHQGLNRAQRRNFGKFNRR